MATKKTKTAKTASRTAAKKAASFDKSRDVFLRAAKVIPSAIYGHQSPAITVPGSFPYYATHGKGAYYWDVDGNRYIDYMCAYGPMVVGYANPLVDKAAYAEFIKGNCFNHPSPLMVDLAEYMVDLIPFADWAVFAKNGSDVTTWATLVAREATSRKRIVACKSEYHGAHPWCTPGHGGIIEEDRSNMLYYTWNKIDELRALFTRYKGEIAGVIMTPFHHPAFGDSEMPAPGFWQGVRKLCDDNGAVLIRRQRVPHRFILEQLRPDGRGFGDHETPQGNQRRQDDERTRRQAQKRLGRARQGLRLRDDRFRTGLDSVRPFRQ